MIKKQVVQRVAIDSKEAFIINQKKINRKQHVTNKR